MCLVNLRYRTASLCMLVIVTFIPKVYNVITDILPKCSAAVPLEKHGMMVMLTAYFYFGANFMSFVKCTLTND